MEVPAQYMTYCPIHEAWEGVTPQGVVHVKLLQFIRAISAVMDAFGEDEEKEATDAELIAFARALGSVFIGESWLTAPADYEVVVVKRQQMPPDQEIVQV